MLPLTYATTFFKHLNALVNAGKMNEELRKYPLPVWIGPDMPPRSEFYLESHAKDVLNMYLKANQSEEIVPNSVKAIKQHPHIILRTSAFGEARGVTNFTELRKQSDIYLDYFLRCFYHNYRDDVTRCVSLDSSVYNALVGYGATPNPEVQAASQTALALQIMHIHCGYYINNANRSNHITRPIPASCQEIVLEAFWHTEGYREKVSADLEYMLGIRSLDQPNGKRAPSAHNVKTLRLIDYPLVLEDLGEDLLVKGHNIPNLIVHMSNVEDLTVEMKAALQQCVNNSETLKLIEIRTANGINWRKSDLLHKVTKTTA